MLLDRVGTQFSFHQYLCQPGKTLYADIGLNEWIDRKIEVQGEKAKLYLNGSQQPVLAVNDLKHGADASGAIRLWVNVGTEGYFTEVCIWQRDR